MKSATALLLRCIALVCVAFALPAAHAGEWLRMESEHFTITSNGPEAQSRSYLEKLEAFRTMSMGLLSADANSTRAQTKFDIVLLRRQLSLKKVRPEFGDNIGGVYCNCSEGSTAYATLDGGWQRQDIDTALERLFHEYAHHLMFQYSRAGYPSWYVEGFAEFLATAIIKKDSIRLGEVSIQRAGDLRQDDWLPFKRILASDANFGNGKSRDASDGAAFYAQSWLLTHYMLTDTQRVKNFKAYFERLNAGEDALAAFEPATGIAVDALQGVLRAYYQDMKAYLIPLDPKKASPAISVLRLPDDADDYQLIATVLKTCPAEAHGKTLLAQLRALAGKTTNRPEGLRLALDRAEILYGDTAVALADLRAPFSDLSESAEFERHYLRGRALMRSVRGQHDEAANAAIREAQGEFLAAYRLKKIDAANLYFLSRALMIDGISTNALNAARGARALAPSVADYAVQEALLDIESKDRDRAASALLPLTFDPHQPMQAARVRRAIEAIKADASTQEVERLLNESGPPAKP